MSEQANTACVSRRTPTTLPMTSLHLSRFNARTQRATQHITTLAERIQRNGFEPTRALWVYPVNGHYEVFAGGTRLAAAREAGLSEVPVVLYEGYDDTAISRLADEDNENDEYHVPVPLPDVWAEYRRLKDEEGWTHERISQAKGVNRATVTLRMGYAEFPEKVLAAFVKNDFLKESHASEMSKLLDFNNLTPWLTRDQALTEILASMLEKHRGGSTGLAPTASVFASAVKTWNVMLTAAADAIAGFPQRVEDGSTIFVPHEAFLAALATRTVRTAKDVVMVAGQITGQLQAIERRRLAMIEAEHRRLTAEQEAAEREADRLATERHRKAYIESRLSWLHHGDCRTLIPTHCPGDIRLVLTDPPYGKQFQSNRRVTTKKKSVMPGDASPEEAACLLAEMLAVMTPKLLPDAHLLVFTHQDIDIQVCFWKSKQPV
jgi:ParB/RepB/Spo0J family partition protein